MAVQIDTLTGQEVIDVEDAANRSITELSEPGKPNMRLMIALAWVLIRRKDQKFTYDMAKAIPFADLMSRAGITESGDVDPEAGRA